MDEVGADVPYVRGAWGSRPSSPARTAAALHGFLGELAALDPTLTSWAVEEGSPLPGDPESLTALIIEQAARARAAEPWRLTVTSTGDRRRAVAVTVRDGNQKNHPIYLNEVIVEPTPVAGERSLFTAHGRALLDGVVRRWQPDVVTLADLRLQRAQTSARRRPPVGGLTWFADTCGSLPNVLPEGARTYRLEAGTCVDLLDGHGAFPSSDRVAEVAAWLDRAGVRESLPHVQRAVVA